MAITKPCDYEHDDCWRDVKTQTSEAGTVTPHPLWMIVTITAGAIHYRLGSFRRALRGASASSEPVSAIGTRR